MILYSVAVDGWNKIQTSGVYDGHLDVFTEMGSSSSCASVLLFTRDAAFSLLLFNKTSYFSLCKNRMSKGEVAALKNSCSRMEIFAFRFLHSRSVRTPLKKFNTTIAYIQLLKSAILLQSILKQSFRVSVNVRCHIVSNRPNNLKMESARRKILGIVYLDKHCWFQLRVKMYAERSQGIRHCNIPTPWGTPDSPCMMVMQFCSRTRVRCLRNNLCK